MVYPKLAKDVCDNYHISCPCPSCVSQLDKYWLTNFTLSYQTRYSCVLNCYYSKALDHSTSSIIIEVL